MKKTDEQLQQEVTEIRRFIDGDSKQTAKKVIPIAYNVAIGIWTNISPFFFILRGSVCYNGTNTSPLLNYTMGTQYKTNKRRLENGTFRKEKRSERTKTD